MEHKVHPGYLAHGDPHPGHLHLRTLSQTGFPYKKARVFETVGRTADQKIP
jgi:hypothetical protein